MTQAIGPCGISHVAVVTADLDRFRTFYEDVIGLRTTVVFGPAHAREAVLMAGSVMIQAFEIAGYDPAARVVLGHVRTGPPGPPRLCRS